jgi:23S rRNA pseudouridine1911/1915/1917 synthase
VSEETVLQSRVPPQAQGLRLCEWLAGRFRYHDESEWRALIAQGRVQHNGAAAMPDALLQRGDLVAYRPMHEEPRANAAIDILHDEGSFAVVFKPAHLVSHADGAFVKNTFFRFLEQRYAERGEHPRLSLAHRLDRETSGLLLVAKTLAASRSLQRQFTAGQVAKEYLAVVHGVVAEDAFAIDGPIGRDPQSRISIRRAVLPAGTAGAQPARTEITVLQRLREFTLVRAVPRTGRTHQIRVHLEHRGHPIVGDKLYGRSDDDYLEWVHHVKGGGDASWNGRLGADRQLLHAGALAFAHPETGAPLRFEAPMPEDMRAFLGRNA